MFCVTLVGTTGSPTELGFQFRVSIGKDGVTAGLAQMLWQYTHHIKALDSRKCPNMLHVIYTAYC